MYNQKECEKQIVISFIKMEIAKKNIEIEKASKIIGVSTDIMRSVFANTGKFYTTSTLMTWAESLASPSSLYEILERNIDRKASYSPKNDFYKIIWNFIANLDNEKNPDS